MKIRITNDVLATKIDNLHERVNEINDRIKDELCPSIKENTAFRLRAKGAISILAFAATLFGGGIMWLINKLSNKGGVP